MADEKTQILFHLSKSFKEAIETFAAKTNDPTSKIVREAIAAYIGYDLKQDNIIYGRPKKDDSKARLAKLLAAELAHEEHIESVEALENWLKRKAGQNKA